MAEARVLSVFVAEAHLQGTPHGKTHVMSCAFGATLAPLSLLTTQLHPCLNIHVCTHSLLWNAIEIQTAWGGGGVGGRNYCNSLKKELPSEILSYINV